MSDGGSNQRRPWQEGLDAHLRKRVLEKIEMKLTEVHHGPLHSTDAIHNAASKYETRTFEGASSKEEYLRTISQRLVSLEQRQKQKRVQQGSASGLQQQHPVQPVNAVQATHGGNSSVSSASSQVASALPNDGRQSSQMQSLPTTSPTSGLVPNQRMAACPLAPNMQIKVNQEQGQILNSCQASVTPPASAVQHSERMVPSAATQNSNQLSAGQMQLANFLGCDPATLVQALDRPNRKKNPFLRQNAKGTDQLTVNQRGLGFNQQPMDRDKSQMLGVVQRPNAANKTHNDHLEAHNSQQNPAGMTVGLQSMLKVREQEAPDKHINMEHQPIGAQQLITVSQQNSSHCTLPQTSATTGSVGEVDWRDEMFQQIKQLKDVYLSDLMEMNQMVTIPNITEEQLESLPKDKAEKYRFNVHMKKKITMMLKFLLFQKSNIPENLRGQLPMFVKSIQDSVGCYKKSKARKEEMDERHRSLISHGHRQIVNISSDLVPSGGSASHQKQQEQLAVSQLEHTVPTTSVAPQQIHSNRLVGVERYSFTEKSRRSLQSLPAHKLKEHCGPSPVTKPGVATVSSPSPSLKSTSPSPDAMLGAQKAKTSPSVAVKSTFPTLVAKPGVVEGSTPSTSVKSILPSHFAESADVQAALPCASSKSKLPSPLAQLADTEAASPRALVKSTLPSLVANSGLDPVASVCSSVKPTSSENFDSVYALLLEDNSAAATTSAHAAIGGATTAEANCSKQVTVATAAAQAAIVGATEAEANGDQQVTCTNSIMPASPLQAQTADILEGDNNRGGAETPVAKKPIDRLLDAIRAASSATLHSSANSLYSIVHMNDWQPHNKTDASQDWAFLSHQGGSHMTNKLKRAFESTPSYFESPPLGSMDGSRMAFARAGSETESSVGGGARMQKKQRTRDALSEEINSVNHMLLDTIISIDTCGMDGITSSNRERLITLSYTGMSLAPDLKLLLATSGMSAVMPPMKLLVPADYPRRSPVIIRDLCDKRSLTMSADVSSVADEALWRSLRMLPEPMSVRDMATAWDQCVRRAVVEFARQYGGGTISSTYGQWERL